MKTLLEDMSLLVSWPHLWERCVWRVRHPLKRGEKVVADDKTSHCSKKEIVTESDGDVAGYRLVQLENLSSVLSSVHRCEEGQ